MSVKSLATRRQEILRNFLFGHISYAQATQAFSDLDVAKPAPAPAPARDADAERKEWVDNARKDFQAREKARLARYRATKARKLARAKAAAEARAARKAAKSPALSRSGKKMVAALDKMAPPANANAGQIIDALQNMLALLSR